MTAAPIRLLRSFATVGGWTMASRVLGFVRDIMIAALLGTGAAAEAFFVAFRLPNMFRRFFAEGAFNTAFVPMFAKRLEGEGAEEARRFAEQAMAALASALILLTLVAQLAMPWFVLALASGLDETRFDLAVVFSRICFPYILFVSLAALFSGVLNSFGRFAVAAAAPVLLNVVLIGSMALAWWAELPVGWTLAWATFFGGIAQLLLVAAAARRLGMALRPRLPRMTPQVRQLVRLGIPAALAGGVMQINLVVGTQVASYFDGAVGWLWYADRVYQLPLGVVGVAIGVVLLPELSRRVRAGEEAGSRDAMNRAAEFCLILTVPSAIALLVIPELITDALFQRGAFDASDTEATALALRVYALGLPAFVLQKILQPAFFAREDTRSPFRYALAGMVANLVIAVGLAPLVGWVAAAIGTTAAAWAMVILLHRGARGFGESMRPDDRLARRWPRIVAASLVMGAAVWALARALERLPQDWQLAGFIALVLSGMAIYTVAAGALGAFRPAEIRAAMSRGRGKART